MDEALRGGTEALRRVLDVHPEIERAVLIDDIFGLLRAVFWARGGNNQGLSEQINTALSAAADPYWSRQVWDASSASAAEKLVYDRAWQDGKALPGSDRLRISMRHRSLGVWLETSPEPLWKPHGEAEPGSPEGPAIIVFYSFKGGMGRSTALASFAIQRARLGDAVVVVDFDIDSPGVGTLLAADEEGTIAPWGVVDYMLERRYGEIPLKDYYHACRREKLTGAGEILVVPSGQLDENYLAKLARIDFESPELPPAEHPLPLLLDQVKRELNPKWILLDARTGLSEPAGLLLSGVAHLHVLFGTTSKQSWQGLRLVLKRLGEARVVAGLPQLECLLVQAMVPVGSRVAQDSRDAFADRARDEFTESFYAQDPQDADEDKYWYIRDVESDDAPHAPVAIAYEPRLAHFDDLIDVAEDLAGAGDYRNLANRIASRFGENGA